MIKSLIPEILSPAERMKAFNLGYSTIDPNQFRYRPKPKLDGTNACVAITNGEVKYFSKNAEIFPGKDNCGFCAWASTVDFASLPDMVVVGEWAGPGVDSRDIVKQIPQKTFFVFMTLFSNGDEWHEILIPEIIASLSDRIKIVPFLDYEFASLEDESINDLVAVFEVEDPYIKAEYGLSGPGEGVVLYPVIKNPNLEELSVLMSKAKCQRHAERKGEKPVGRIIPVKDIGEFLEKFLTEERLHKKYRELANQGTLTKASTGAFIQLIQKDLEKECQTDLEEANLTWADVHKESSKVTRQYFFDCLEA